jgi:hypothetical protein
MRTFPEPVKGASMLSWAQQIRAWILQDRVKAGAGLTEAGRVISLAKLPRAYDFEVTRVGPAELRIGPGHYGAVDQALSSQDERFFTVSESGWLIAKFTYATTIAGNGSWHTENDDNADASIVYPVTSLPAIDPAYRIIPVQKFTLTSGTTDFLPPQSWLGHIWTYDQKVCFDPPE